MPESNSKKLCLLECNIDDMNPEYFPHVFEQLFTAGCRDTWITPILMKNGRPAHCLSVLCELTDEAKMAGIVFAETSTLGIRRTEVERLELQRRHEEVITPFGPVRLKIATATDGKILNVAPEHSDCRALAKANNIALKEVYQLAIAAFYTRHSGDSTTKE